MDKVFQFQQLLEALQTHLWQGGNFKLNSSLHFSHHCLCDELQRPGQCANTELHGIEDGEDGEGLRGGQLHSCQGHRDEGGEAGHDGDGGGHGGAYRLQQSRLSKLLDLLLSKCLNPLKPKV